MTKPQSCDAIYLKGQFESEIIVWCVRWYITYKLSYRDLVEMMAERGPLMRRISRSKGYGATCTTR